MTNKAIHRRNVYADITNQLITAIESSPGELALPWRRRGGYLHMPVNAQTGQAYRGVNVISLWVVAETRGYDHNLWATYRQWAELGAQVRKNEKSAHVIFYKEYEAEPDPQNPNDTGKRRIARASSVFNATQVDGYGIPQAPTPLSPVDRLQRADAFVAATGACVRHGGDRAYYHSERDQIQMPDEGLFFDTKTLSRTEGYYATLLHELIHWTGPAHRLDRDMGKRFGDRAYAAEELVAEIGAAFLCAELGITAEVRPDHASYLANWLQLLKDDDRAIFSAAARASEAAIWLTNACADR